MRKSLRKLLVFGKELSIFTGILLVLLFVFSCNNMINIRGGGNLIIAIPGARAATASSFTIELTGSSGATQNKPVSGGSTVQFDDLAPDTYNISVKGMDDAGTVVFSGSAKATVVAGETATVMVDLESALGNLTVSFEGAESDSVAKYTVILSGPNESKETQEVTARTVQFEGLIPGDYNISVLGQDSAGAGVLSGTAKATVVEGQPVTATVNLELSPGSLTVNFEGAESVSVVKYNVTLSGPNEFEETREVESKSVQFDDLAPDTYRIIVKAADDSGAVVLYGTSDATVTAGATASATVKMSEVVNDYNSLSNAISTGGIVYIGSDINVASPLTVNTDVTLLPAYKNVTLTNNSSGNLFTVADSSENLTIGGGEYTITLDGNQVAQSIISVSGGTATLADNGIITNAAASAVNISSSGTFEMTGGEISNNESSTYNGGGGITISGGTFNMTGGRIIDNTGSQSSGGVTVSGGTFNMTGGSITGNIGSNGGGVTIAATGKFNMTGGIITNNMGSTNGGAVFMNSGTFSMTGGSITDNTAGTTGGGVQVSGGTFVLSGGSISNNSANQGSGVQVSSGTFTMGGSAVVAPDNDVYLLSGKMITVAGTLSGATPVATITPNTTDGYAEGTQVLSAESGVDLAVMVEKFAVTPDTDGTQWTIDTAGKLQKAQ